MASILDGCDGVENMPSLMRTKLCKTHAAFISDSAVSILQPIGCSKSLNFDTSIPKLYSTLLLALEHLLRKTSYSIIKLNVTSNKKSGYNFDGLIYNYKCVSPYSMTF